MYGRRELLRTAATGLALGAGTAASGSSAAGADASFAGGGQQMLAAPTGVAVVEVTGTADGWDVAVEWEPVEAASSYVVYVGEAAAHTTAETETVVEADVHGEIADVGVAAATDAEESDVATATLEAPEAPTGVHVVDRSQTGVTLGWDAVDLASTYDVYAGDSIVETTTDTEATIDLDGGFGDGQIGHGDLLELGVAASNPVDDSSITRVSLVEPSEPTGLAVRSESLSEATVGWDAVENADSYNVYADDAFLHSTEETETTITEFPTEDTYVEVGIEAANAAGESSTEEILVRRCVDEPTLDDPGYDVDCDQAVGQSDVAEFFSKQHREAWKRRPDLFDYSGNGDVTHGDVVELFDYVALN